MFVDFNHQGGSAGGIEPPQAALLGSRKVCPDLKSLGKPDKPPSGESADKAAEQDRRDERWALKWQADDLRRLPLFEPGWAEKHGLDKQRFKSAFFCHRHAKFKSDWSINFSDVYQKASFYGQFSCGSVWQCPVCAAKIAVRRRDQLMLAMETAKALGFNVYFITFTVRHGIGDDLKDILKKMQKSFAGITGGRWAAEIKEKIGRVGYIKVLEVTYGENGWHPHFHVLLFVNKQQTAKQIEDIYAPKWIDICVKNGLPVPLRQYACTIQNGTKAAEYVVKFGMVNEIVAGHQKRGWGAVNEMVSGHQKRGRQSGRTPWELLDDSSKGDAQASYLFLQYADAFFNKHQLVWSDGLKVLLNVDDMSDQQIVDAPDEEPVRELMVLDDLQIEALVYYKLWQKVLRVAEDMPNDLQSFIAMYTDKYYTKFPDKKKEIMRQMMRRKAKEWEEREAASRAA